MLCDYEKIKIINISLYNCYFFQYCMVLEEIADVLFLLVLILNEIASILFLLVLDTVLRIKSKCFSSVDNEWVHALGVSIEIELEMDWQGCKRYYNFQIFHFIGQWD